MNLLVPADFFSWLQSRQSGITGVQAGRPKADIARRLYEAVATACVYNLNQDSTCKPIKETNGLDVVHTAALNTCVWIMGVLKAESLYTVQRKDSLGDLNSKVTMFTI